MNMAESITHQIEHFIPPVVYLRWEVTFQPWEVVHSTETCFVLKYSEIKFNKVMKPIFGKILLADQFEKAIKLDPLIQKVRFLVHVTGYHPIKKVISVGLVLFVLKYSVSKNDNFWIFG